MEPERNIEKWLRAFGKKRRDEAGAPLELHPATRRLLQGEVARHAARRPKPSEGSPFLNFLALLRPKLAFAVPVAVIGLIVVLIGLPALNRSKSRSTSGVTFQASQEVADKEMATPAEEEMRKQDSVGRRDYDLPKRLEDGRSLKVETATASVDEKKKDQTSAIEPLSFKEASSSASNFITGTALAITPTNLSVASGFMTAATDQPSAPTVAAAAAPGSVNRGGGGGAGGAVGGGFGGRPADLAKNAPVRFSRLGNEVDAATGLATPAQAFADVSAVTNELLTSFAVEQNGRELRIVDRDGSVYQGYMQFAAPLARVPATAPVTRVPAEAQTPATPASTPARRAADRANETTAEACTFEVSGTNRSLQQRIVFSGSISVTNGVLLEWGPNSEAWGDTNTMLPGSFPQVQLMNSRISGRAVIGNSRPVEIQAAPVPR